MLHFLVRCMQKGEVRFSERLGRLPMLLFGLLSKAVLTNIWALPQENCAPLVSLYLRPVSGTPDFRSSTSEHQYEPQ